MPYLMVRQRVIDYDKWYAVFEAHAEAQRESGLVDLQLMRDVSDPNTIVCFFRVEDIARARDFTRSPEADSAKDKSGVIGTPEVLWLDEI